MLSACCFYLNTFVDLKYFNYLDPSFSLGFPYLVIFILQCKDDVAWAPCQAK